MKIDLKDVDVYISEILKDIDNEYNLAMHVVLLESIKEIGLNKDEVIKKVEEAIDEEKLVKLCNASFGNKIYLKNFIYLEKEEREQIINKLIEIIKKCDEQDGILVIPQRPQLVEIKKDQKIETINIFEINDPELGNIKIEESGKNGKISSDKIKIHGFNFEYKIPVVFKGIYDFEIKLLTAHKEEFDEKNYINNLKTLLSSEKYITEKIISFVIDFFEEDKNEECIKINISARAYAYYNQDDSINISISFDFEEEEDEVDGYIDAEFNCNTKELDIIGKGYY